MASIATPVPGVTPADVSWYVLSYSAGDSFRPFPVKARLHRRPFDGKTLDRNTWLSQPLYSLFPRAFVPVFGQVEQRAMLVDCCPYLDSVIPRTPTESPSPPPQSLPQQRQELPLAPAKGHLATTPPSVSPTREADGTNRAC